MTAFERLKVRTGEADDALLTDLLESARAAIIARRHPFGDGTEEMEDRYTDLQVRIAEAMYNKLGADYQTGHTENGVSRQWASEGIPEALLREVTPLVGVPK